MKRLACAFLTLVLLMTGLSCLADEDPIYFEATLANALDYSLEEWFSTSYNRALLTVLLTLDMASEAVIGQSMWTNLLKNETFICFQPIGILLINGYVDDDLIAIGYRSLPNTAVYDIQDTSYTSEFMPLYIVAAMSKRDEYYINDSNDIMTAVSNIYDIITTSTLQPATTSTGPLEKAIQYLAASGQSFSFYKEFIENFMQDIEESPNSDLTNTEQSEDRSIIELLDSYIVEAMDGDKTESAEPRSSDFDATTCTIDFDLRDGYKTIGCNDGMGHYKVYQSAGEDSTGEALEYHPFTNEKILQVLFRLIPSFSEIEGKLPDGKHLKLLIWITDDDRCYITDDNIIDFKY